MRALLFVLIGLVIVSQSNATGRWPWNEFANPHWQLKCHVGAKTVMVHFDSLSGTADNDDMVVSITDDNKKLPVAFASGVYEALPTSINAKGLCDRGVGLSVGKGQLLLLFGYNNRPSPSQVVGVLLDLDQDKALAAPKSLGQFNKIDGKGHDLIEVKAEKIAGGVRLWLDQGYKKNTKSNGADGILFGWKNIIVKNNDIEAKWEKPTPKNYDQWD